MPQSAKAQLAEFIAKYTPAVAAEGKAVLKRMRAIMPGAVELVYDNYQWLVVGFCPNERASDAITSVVFTPKWITICFLQNGPKLPDPEKLLRGSGKRVRSIRLASAKEIDAPAIRALIDAAIRSAREPIDASERGRLVIKSISARQKPRRPPAAKPSARDRK